MMSSGYFEVYQDTSAQLNEFFNEIIIILTLYTIMCFTNFVTDQTAQLKVGFASCTIVVVHLLINIIRIVTGNIREFILKIKRFLYQRQRRSSKITNDLPIQPPKVMIKKPHSVSALQEAIIAAQRSKIDTNIQSRTPRNDINNS